MERNEPVVRRSECQRVTLESWVVVVAGPVERARSSTLGPGRRAVPLILLDCVPYNRFSGGPAVLSPKGVSRPLARLRSTWPAGVGAPARANRITVFVSRCTNPGSPRGPWGRSRGRGEPPSICPRLLSIPLLPRRQQNTTAAVLLAVAMPVYGWVYTAGRCRTNIRHT